MSSFLRPPLRSVIWGFALAVAGLLAACGGGGGGSVEETGGGGATPRAPLPALSQDIVPAGERIDRVAADHFVARGDNTWTYQSTDSRTGQTRVVTRSIGVGAGGDLIVAESGADGFFTETWRRTAEGLLLIEPLSYSGLNLGVGPPPSLLMYAEPFYPVGAERRLIRQGSLGADVTGDGLSDSYRLEYAQVFLGLETVTLPSGTLNEVAHFRNVFSILVQPSDAGLTPVTFVATEHVWWAPGLGLVRAERSVADGDGQPVDGTETLVLTGGRIDGRELFLPEPDGTVTALPLPHHALVYDPARNRYYASVPGSVPVRGNSIATIDPATGTVTYSAAVGSEPSALALSADGSVLHVGLDGSADVLRLRLPDLQELGRTRLAADPFFGPLFADTLTVSPLDPGLVAVAMRRKGVSPRHGGVALIRDGVLQPVVTQDHTGSNLVAFGADGASVYGFNNENTEFGLRRLEVLPDGLREVQVLRSADGNFGTRDLSLTPQGLLLDRALYRTPDLAPLGRHAADGGGCRWHAAIDRVVCLGSQGGGADRFLTVADPTSFVIQAMPVFQSGYGQEEVVQIVPGPRGQVALRIGPIFPGDLAGVIWLFTTPALD
jgi:hypothetical protein